jgi:CheY-like chemotaxis protein
MTGVTFQIMKTKLQILLLEDSSADAELIAHELAAAGFSFSLARVETEPEFRQHLSAEPDLILSDHGLPSFGGFKALEIVRETHPQLPFIFVSGSNDQEMVIEMYESGATDYVFKRDIKDLRCAVKNALESAPAAEMPAQPVTPPPPVALPPPFKPLLDHLSFCPQCHQAWDQAGHNVLIEDYCGHHAETIVSCHVCLKCGHAHK